jgi:transposase
MTDWGGKIQDVSLARLRERLVEEDDAKATKRLVAAIEYKHGLSPAEIESKYGISQHTVYEWLDRFETRAFDEALYDGRPPGRPAGLSSEQRDRLASVLSNPPREVGFDAQAWTPELVRTYLDERFGVDYSLRHVRRLVSQVFDDR